MSDKEEKKRKKVSMGTIVSISCVAFGIHVGGGFATGNQTVAFFVKYGWVAILLPIGAMLILNLVFREGLINSQMNGTKNYREFSDAVYYPAQKVFSNVYEVCYIVILILAISASIAGSAALLTAYHIPYVLGVLLTGVVFFLLTIFGKELLAKASTFMTVCIVVALLILLYFGLSATGADLGAALTTSNMPLGIGAAIWSMLQYAGYQSYTVATLTPYAATLRDRKSINKMVLVNFVLNTSMILLSVILLLAWQPQIAGETLPIFSIAMLTGHAWLQHIYAVILFFAFISTGIGCIFGFVTRFETRFFLSLGLVKRRAIFSLTGMIVSMAVSMLGLTVIVAKGYAYMGAIGIFLLIVPCLTLVARRNAKRIVTFKKKEVE
jgi:uncharacterized membrane protein YkvI